MTKPIAYNYLGEIVYEGADGVREIGFKTPNLARENSENSDPRFLRISVTSLESVWLCATAFVFQPLSNPKPIDEFFKLCSKKLNASDRKTVIEFFIVEALHAFYRAWGFQIDSPQACHQTLESIKHRFDALRFSKALSKMPNLAGISTPEAVLTIRAAVRSKALPPLILNKPWFDPLSLTRQPSIILPSAYQFLPWSLAPASKLSDPPSANPQPPVSIQTNALFVESNEDGAFRIPRASGDILLTLGESLKALRDSHSSEIARSGRHAYKPLTTLAASSSSLSTSLFLAHEQLAQIIRVETPDWDSYVSGLLHLDAKTMAQRLSAEQIDACGIAARSFSFRKSFILADETGLGKGRALAALAKAFLDTGRKVAFVTEKRHLFSDFWRDLCDVYGGAAPPTPFMLHPKGRVITPTGALLIKAPPQAKYKEIITSKQPQSDLLFTTYSQFNRDSKFADKHILLEDHLSGGLLILDESHNASGESQTRANMLRLIEASAKCVFSSATYAKHEQAFALYASATPLTRNELALLLSSFAGSDPLAASNSIAHGLVKIGSMVRREHQPEPIQDSLIITPNSESSESIETQRQKLHEALESLFTLQDFIDDAKRNRGEDTDASWMKLGGVLARLCKQFNLLSKLDLACETVLSILYDQKKPVIALESTFETFLKAQISWGFNRKIPQDILDDDDSDDDDDSFHGHGSVPTSCLEFPALFKLIIETIAPASLLLRLNDPRASQAKTACFNTAENLPKWLASPIDVLRRKLSEKGFTVGEVSGRARQVDLNADGSVSVSPRISDDREKVVRQFNNGEIDVLILTQAGASGISLHAAPDFQDQRQRAFVELEICSNPSQRVQFLGRVRRKGQTSSPQYYVVSSGSPYEHRLIERASSKQMMLSGLTAATQRVTSGSLTIANRIITPQGDRIAIEWLKFHKDISRKLGIDPNNPIGKASNDTIAERLLKRLPLLSSASQNDIFAFMTSALSIDVKIPVMTSTNETSFLNKPMLIRNKLIWGPATAVAKSTGPQSFEPSVYFQEWVCMPPVGNLGSQAVDKRLSASADHALDIKKLEIAASNALARKPSPQDEVRLQALRAAAPHLAIGSKIRISHPDTGRPLDGIVTSVEPPPNPEWLLYPSQWKITSIFPGQPFEMALSLATFFTDPHAYLERCSMPHPRQWDSYQQRPYHFSTIDGHCGYGRWYASQFNAKTSARFIDSQGINRELSMLPDNSSSDDALSWKIPLIDPRLALQLLQHDTEVSLDNAPREGLAPSASISPTAGGWTLTLERELHDIICDYALERRLGQRKYHYENGVSVVKRFISIRDIHAVIPMLHLRQCRFFSPSSRRKWHAIALDLLLTTAKTTRRKR